ncbi:MAG: phosphatase PAP2 family protein [Actinomycetota bacterium]|nr:phosphatase PAP2 family protein [Actinomycetota bacterium]MDQ6947061.1 phosphatase PAP2 family protein [Actinomycetota bacterium]
MAVTSDRLGRIRPILDTEWLDEPRRRSPLWVEVLVVVWLCWLYDAISNLSPLRLHAAMAHATSILHFENVWHLNPELSLNTWAAAHRAIALPMADFYDTAHFVVTLGVVAWLWWRHPGLYRPLRNSLVFINVIGFLVFWAYPLAPPRMMYASGFIDVVAVTHAWGSWRTSAVASQANELAAMPSLHVAWACWTSVALWHILGHRRWRILALAYPVMTALVVMATANHFLLDVVAGVATVAAASGVAALCGATRNLGRPSRWPRWGPGWWPGWGSAPISGRPTRMGDWLAAHNPFRSS